MSLKAARAEAGSALADALSLTKDDGLFRHEAGP